MRWWRLREREQDLERELRADLELELLQIRFGDAELLQEFVVRDRRRAGVATELVGIPCGLLVRESGSSSAGAFSRASSIGSASARRILPAVATSLSGMR